MITRLTNERERPELLVYDLEWVPGSMELRIVGVFDGQGYRYYRTVAEFIAGELTYRNRGKWFYAHAGGMADFQFLLPELHRQGYFVQGAISGSSVITARITKGTWSSKRQCMIPGRNVWHFVDSFWLLRDSLRAIGGWLGAGFEKGNVEQSIDWYRTASFEELRDYNEQDCRILYAGIKLFEQTFYELGGQLKKTQASCAMDLFRRRFLTRDVRTHDAVNTYAREAYYASRVEVFSHYTEDARYYDINSSFPFAMTAELPGEFNGSVTGRLPTKPGPYLADVEVEVPDIWLPPLPKRYGHRLFFPTGRWRGLYSGVDVELLERAGGRILKVHRSLMFQPFHDLKGYVDEIYALRKESTGFPKQVYKLALNSLYGKFGESEVKTQLMFNPPEIDPKWGPGPMPGIYLYDQIADIPHMHTPLAVYVTAIARRRLYDFMAEAGSAHYCDTDGFSTFAQFVDNKELGGLKLEKNIEKAWFIQPKMYGMVVGGKFEAKAKGFSLGKLGEQQLREQFELLRSGGKIPVRRMARVSENIRRGDLSPREVTYLKGVSLNSIKKRQTLDNGVDTRPWTVGELTDMLEPTELIDGKNN